MTRRPMIAVVIPTRDRAPVLAGTLERVAALDVPDGWDTQLVIVDNDSTDDTPVVAATGTLAGRPATVIHLEQPGVSRARNRGAKAAADADVILFLDDDVRPPAHWLRETAEPILRGAAAAACLFELVEEEPQDWLTDGDRRSLISRDSVDPDEPFLIGGAMGISRAYFDKIGGFTPELGPGALGAGGEDILLTHQVVGLGGEIVCVTGARCEHWMPAARVTPGGMKARAAQAARSEAWLAYHWFHRTDRFARVKAAILRPLELLGYPDSRRVWHEQMAREQTRPRKFVHPDVGA